MNSNDVNSVEQLASWIGTGRANISNEFTDKVSANGLNAEFSLLGIEFVVDDWVPAGYIVMFGGVQKQKPLKFHEPANDQFRGLLWVQGKNDASLGKYPIVDSYVMRFFKVRSWQRWQGCVYQISATGPYTAPSDY